MAEGGSFSSAQTAWSEGVEGPESSAILNKESLSEQVERALKEEILSGRLAPEQRVDLSTYRRNWSVSATPLRDAVKLLEAAGLVEISPRRGVFVSRLDRKALKDIFDLRIALECKAIELATPFIPVKEAQQVLSLYSRAKNARQKDRAQLLQKTDLLIHDLAVKYCGNPRLIKVMEDLRDLIRWSQQTIIRHLREPFEVTLPEHIRITEAVCARDAASAATAMRIHLENTYKRVEAFLEEQSGSRPLVVQ